VSVFTVEAVTAPWMQAFNQLMAALAEAKRVLAQTEGAD
jgi:hypothetical protein